MEESVQAYLERVVEVVREVVSDNLVAGWALGSLATGDFDLRCSDLDVMVVLAASLAPCQRESLVRNLSHDQLECPAHGLDLIAYAEAELRGLSRTPHYEFSLSTGADWDDEVGEGGPYAGGIPDLELARTRGLRLAGYWPNEILAPVPIGWLREEADRVIRWHKERIHHPFHDPDGSNAVLNACRACRLILTGELVSKSEGARWWLEMHDEDVVEAALRTRGEGRSERLNYAKVRSFLEGLISQLAEGTT